MTQSRHTAVQSRQVVDVHAATSEPSRLSDAASILDNAVDLIYTLDLDGNLTYVSPSLLRELGYAADELLGQWARVIIDEADHARTTESFEARLRDEAVAPYVFSLARRDGSRLEVEIVSGAIRDRDGGIIGTQAILRDMSLSRTVMRELEARVEERTASLHAANEQLREEIERRSEVEARLLLREEQLRLLVRELDHRVRNNLCSLVTLIDLSARSCESRDSLATTIRGRVQAVASVHGVLSNGRWAPTSLRALIESITPIHQRDQVRMDGVSVRVGSRQVTALGMVLHEMLTNATRHGSLASSSGTVEISWTLDGDDHLSIEWREVGGEAPTAELTPGMGTEIVRGLARSELGGAVEMRYPPDGACHLLTVTLDAPDEAPTA